MYVSHAQQMTTWASFARYENWHLAAGGMRTCTTQAHLQHAFEDYTKMVLGIAHVMRCVVELYAVQYMTAKVQPNAQCHPRSLSGTH